MWRLLSVAGRFQRIAPLDAQAPEEDGSLLARLTQELLPQAPNTPPPLLSALPPVQGTQFKVIVTEGRPDETGITTARALKDAGVPTSLVLDSGVGYAMEKYARRDAR